MWPFAREIHAWLQGQTDATAVIKINEAFRDTPGIKQALEESKLGWLRMKEATNKPSAVVKLFPKWFREHGQQKYIAVGGNIPVAFQPEPEDSDDEEYMEDAREVELAPRLRMRGKQAVAEPMDELEALPGDAQNLAGGQAQANGYCGGRDAIPAGDCGLLALCQAISNVCRCGIHCQEVPTVLRGSPRGAHGQPEHSRQGSACPHCRERRCGRTWVRSEGT